MKTGIAAGLLLALLLAGSRWAPGRPAPPAPAGIASQLARVNGGSHTPGAPFQVRLTAGAVMAPGRQRVRLEVTPLADAERLEVEVEASDGLAVAAGKTRWEAPARKGETLSGELVLQRVAPRLPPGSDLRRPLDEQRLMVTVSLVRGEDERQGGVALWCVNRKRLRPEEAHPGSRRVRGRGGRGVIEIPGEAP
jgi:hypothetical protein